MATYKITTADSIFVNFPGIYAFAQGTAGADSLTIDPGAFLIATGANAMSTQLAAAGPWKVAVNGTIYSQQSHGIFLAGNTGKSSITVGSEGSIRGVTAILTDDQLTLTNAGVIAGVDIGVSLQGSSFSLNNSGTISGTLFSVHDNENLSVDRITNTGTMIGSVDLGDQNDTLTNQGSIVGSVLVGSDVDTNDAPSAATRLIDMGVKPFLVASALQAVVAQRLARRICSVCKQTYYPDEIELTDFGVDPNKYKDVPLFKGEGCDRCGGSGYRGRVALHEVFVNNPELRQLIMRSESASRIKRIAVEQHGMRSLRIDGWEKSLLGMTTIPEVVRLTQEE